MTKTLTLVSTGVGVVEGLVALARELAPSVRLFNIVDDSVVSEIAANANTVPSNVVKRIATYCAHAEDIGSSGVLITCSSISEVVDVVRPYVNIPVMKIDEPMVEYAVRNAESTIGIVATLQTTMGPTRRMVESKIRTSGKALSIASSVCEGAFPALIRGDGEVHDQIVLTEVRKLLSSCDLVLLAQASMARATAQLDRAEDKSRVLSSPRFGIAAAIRTIEGVE